MPRLQLTLFVPDEVASVLEPIRQRLDPVQHGLIGTHVTLCREDELAKSPLAVLRGLAQRPTAIALTFGAPVGFDSHGILLPCIDGTTEFHRLRAAVLGSTAIRHQAAHITLAHPRNPRAPGNTTPHEIALATPLRITFATISLIEQVDGGPWVVREVVVLESGTQERHPEQSEGSA
ncbi:MAG: 2'-5' RNA ligase family protein [Gemmatimonadetes bacterium]|nr:2'-5' RNA ligase family protein [Gemmatimonadota bacterium]